MEREFGPEGEIIIRGFPENEGTSSQYIPEPYDLEHQRGFRLRRYGFGIFVAVLVLALVGGGVSAFLSFTDAGDEMTEEEWAALVESASSGEDPLSEISPSGLSREGAAGIGPGERISVDIVSQPAGAAVLIDFDSVGVTPLRGHPLAEGVYVISVRFDDQSRIDTVVVVGTEGERAFAFSGRDIESDPRRPEEEVEAREVDDVLSPEASLESSARGDEPAPSRAASDPQELRGQVPDAAPPGASRIDVEPAEPTLQDVVPGELVVTSEPSGASVEIDGAVRGETPLHVTEIEPGEHELRIRLDGYADKHAVLDVLPAQTIVQTYRLDALSGTVDVLVRPWGSIYIDGELRARDLDVRYSSPLNVGTHRIAAVHPVLGRQEVTVQVQPNGTHDVVIDLSSSPGR